ncbi:hypothetical protein [Nocardia carnea]|uniref:hypothetical protein n=1 Tax=Nocardia carnea TaxID=37328 RepID=UPI002454077E|nr:hypothetical protein [Nocardia carnea]
MDSKTKVAGPLAAAGAVSLGLVFIGACGIGQEDTYVPPPPIHSGPQAVEPAGYSDPTATTIAQVVIPPSPSWRIAPDPGPRRTLPPEYQISVTSSAAASTSPRTTGESPDSEETTGRRATLSATPSPEQEPATSSQPAPEIAPAYSESPVPPVSSTETAPPAEPPVAPAPTTTSELPTTEAPAEPEAPLDEQPLPGTEPARTTRTPSAPSPETGQPQPYTNPSAAEETTAPHTTPPVAPITILPAVPPQFGG